MMEVRNKLYNDQGIHVISSIFTVEQGVTKVLLIKRGNEPYKNMWALVGGALYNNEDLLEGMKREINEKVGIDNIELYLSNVFGDKDRSPVMRMVATSYIGVIDSKTVSLLSDNLKVVGAEWFSIDDIPDLAYDHNIIIKDSLEFLKKKIISSDILKTLFKDGFTLPEIQMTYETILGITLDRRNFRKKLLSMNLIKDTNRTKVFAGKKPAKIYKFKKRSKEATIF